MIEHYLIYGIAIYYFASATVMTADYVNERVDNKIIKILSSNKPFICAFCMCIWWSVILYFVPFEYVKIIAIAGIANIIHTIINRINTIFMGE